MEHSLWNDCWQALREWVLEPVARLAAVAFFLISAAIAIALVGGMIYAAYLSVDGAIEDPSLIPYLLVAWSVVLVMLGWLALRGVGLILTAVLDRVDFWRWERRQRAAQEGQPRR